MDSAAATLHAKCLWSVLLIVSFMCNGTFSDMGKMSSSQNHFGGASQSQFATKNNTRVIAQKGGLAILPCVVKLNSPATVSWIRRKDFQLLTVGLSTHSSDKRFLVEHTRHMGHWSLRIKSVREEDRGFYECQLSIYPTQSIFIELKVVEAVADITGAPDLHIDEGSALRLECKLKRATENPAFVFWYHDNKMVNYDAQDGFSVTSTTGSVPPTLDGSSYVGSSSSLRERGNGGEGLGGNNNNNNHSSHTGGHLSSLASLMAAQQHQSSYLLTPSTSVLTIQEVHFHHAGNYTCAPSNARPASITVHVLRGEKPAAMQHANRSVLDSESSNSSSGGSGGTSSSSASGASSLSGARGLPLGSSLRQLAAMLLEHLHLHPQQRQRQSKHLQQERPEQQRPQSPRQQDLELRGPLTWLLAIVTLLCAYHKIDR